PQLVQAGARLHMGQFSMTISAVAGSNLSGNQQQDNRAGLHLCCLTSARSGKLSPCKLFGKSGQVAYYLPIRAKRPKGHPRGMAGNFLLFLGFLAPAVGAGVKVQLTH
ncbi:hypothetical protein, partial [Paracoccus lutimaris]|uniref:hypothetical protein n=1 Tax=Paracoccus lutimaris TaxID=1490030 RepID=UPI001C6A2A80